MAITQSRLTVAALGEVATPDARGRPEAGAPEMTSDQPSTPAARLAMKSPGATRGQLDGGWWPASDDLAAEVPALANALREQVGAVSRVSYHLGTWPQTRRKLWSGGRTIRLEGFHSLTRDTLVVIGSDGRRVVLLLVPHGTPGGLARALLRSAARPDSAETAEQILAGNGSRPSPTGRARERREA
jgi:hypothetical protein